MSDTLLSYDDLTSSQDCIGRDDPSEFASTAKSFCRISGAVDAAAQCQICDVSKDQRLSKRFVVDATVRSQLDKHFSRIKAASIKQPNSLADLLSGFRRILAHSADEELADMDSIALCRLLKQAMSGKSRACRIHAV